MQFPGNILTYNCAPSFNWARNLDADTIAKFPRELGEMGYKFQSSRSPASTRSNTACSSCPTGYRDRGMAAYSELQLAEFAVLRGYTGTRHQREVGTGYFDEIAQVLSGGESSTVALVGSTGADQFH